MVQTGRTLDEYFAMGPPGVVALAHYNAHMGLDTATFRAVQGLKDNMEWSSEFKLATLLADLYDLVAVLNVNVAHINSKRRPKQPKPYPRPWRSAGRVIGRAAVKVKDFWSWWKSN